MQSFHQGNVKAAVRVVLADDDSALRTQIAELLRAAGHVVWEAADGAQAITLVQTHAPDLLLLDSWMPVLNGLEVVEQLAEAPEAVGLKIVVLSSLANADTHLEGYALGVDDCWSKELPVGDLLERIERLMRPEQISSRQTG